MPAVRRATIPVKKQYKMHFAAKSGSCAVTPRSLSSGFRQGRRGAGIWPAVCRPTRHHDGHPAAIAPWCSTRMVGPTCFPTCAVTCAGAPGTLWACPERGAPGAAGACGTVGARGARSASGAPDVPGTLGPQRCLARLARLALVVHLAPAWGRSWFPVAAHPKTAAEHADARVLLMCWEGRWE